MITKRYVFPAIRVGLFVPLAAVALLATMLPWEFMAAVLHDEQARTRVFEELFGNLKFFME